MKYKILDIKNYDNIIDNYLENFADEFDCLSSKAMIKNRKAQFTELVKPIFINELEEQFNKYPETLKEYENKRNGVYVSKVGVKVIIEEKKE